MYKRNGELLALQSLLIPRPVDIVLYSYKLHVHYGSFKSLQIRSLGTVSILPTGPC